VRYPFVVVVESGDCHSNPHHSGPELSENIGFSGPNEDDRVVSAMVLESDVPICFSIDDFGSCTTF
jgi:hypothetical protein